jgi:DNA primase
MSPELLEQRLPRGGGAHASRAVAASGTQGPAPLPPDRGRDRGARHADVGRREPTERSFLALCIALPALGAPALAELDLEADLTSSATRRAAQHLREHLDAPTTGLADDDQLLGFMRELAVGDARTQAATTAAFELERLQLTLARLDREIAAARAAASGDVSKLAQRRWEVQAKLSQAVERAMEDHPAPR